MALVIVASTNPVKSQAVRGGFESIFPGAPLQVEMAAAESGVRRQPLSDQETLEGARLRAQHAALLRPEADYWVGVEGGVEEDAQGSFSAFAWVVVLSREREGKGRTGAFFLPQPVADLLRQGLELGEADDRVFQRSNSKQENGAIGLLSGNAIDRAGLYRDAVIFALLPFKNPALYG
jgi:inosine/xanthosine triphosphatase